MKIKSIVMLMTASLLFCFACSDDEGTTPDVTGEFTVEFDHFVGSSPLVLRDAGSTEYDYTSASGEKFNLNMFGYYVSEIVLEGPEGAYFEDPMNESAAADEVTGYYHVLQSNAPSRFIDLDGVPAGKYDRVTFTIGIREDGVQEGAAGGILDPAEGAWFWNWNAGYIGFAMEGTAENSSQEEVVGDGWVIPEKSYAFHVGGWKDVPAAEGEAQRFVNNTRTLTLMFDSPVTVSESLAPAAHIVVDIMKIMDGVPVDFSTTYSLHSPAAGKPMADQLENAFILDHIHQ